MGSGKMAMEFNPKRPDRHIDVMDEVRDYLNMILEYPNPPEDLEQGRWEDGDPNNPPPEVPDDFENIPFEDAQGLFDDGEEHTLTSDWGWRGLEDENGARDSDFHGGIDIDTSGGEDIHTTGGGTVVHADNDTVIIDHGGGDLSTYEHLGSTNVSEGPTIENGETIGTGSEGHLHYAEHDVGENGTWQERNDENSCGLGVSGETVEPPDIDPEDPGDYIDDDSGVIGIPWPFPSPPLWPDKGGKGGGGS